MGGSLVGVFIRMTVRTRSGTSVTVPWGTTSAARSRWPCNYCGDPWSYARELLGCLGWFSTGAR
eukprot:1894721-Lingulodinium_polyedra.AAC.1